MFYRSIFGVCVQSCTRHLDFTGVFSTVEGRGHQFTVTVTATHFVCENRTLGISLINVRRGFPYNQGDAGFFMLRKEVLRQLARKYYKGVFSTTRQWYGHIQ